MRLSEKNLARLSSLKPEFQKQDQSIYYSNNDVISKLLESYHSIDSLYVKKETFNNLFTEKSELKEEIKILEGKLQDKDSRVQNILSELKQELEEKQKQIHISHVKLEQNYSNIEQLKKNLEEHVAEKQQLEKKLSDSIQLNERLNEEKQSLKLLLDSHIHICELPMYLRLVSFLVAHKRNWYSVEYLAKKLRVNSYDLESIVKTCKQFSPFTYRIGKDKTCFVAYQKMIKI
jgi:DNA repair exonuclease SbcCD ATPase subunit